MAHEDVRRIYEAIGAAPEQIEQYAEGRLVRSKLTGLIYEIVEGPSIEEDTYRIYVGVRRLGTTNCENDRLDYIDELEPIDPLSALAMQAEQE